MAKPTNTPRWANSGGAIVEPTSGKKDVGWVVAEKPPAQFWNWLANLTWQWLDWLSTGMAADQTLIIPPSMYYTNQTVTFNPAGIAAAAENWANGGVANANISVPIYLAVGQRIKSWQVRALGTNIGGETVSASLWKQVNGGNQTQVGATQTTGASGSEEFIGQSGLTEVKAANTAHRINIRFNGTNTTPRVYQTEVVVDWP